MPESGYSAGAAGTVAVMAGAAPHPYRLGFAVKVLGAGGLPSSDTRRWQSGPHLSRSLDLLEAKGKDLAVAWLRIQLARVAPELAGAEERGPTPGIIGGMAPPPTPT